MSEFLSHPLVLLLIGAALSGYLIPAINRQIQARQKELEVKVDLVSELSEIIMKMVMSVQFAHLAPERYAYHENRDEIIKARQDEMNEDYQQWEVDSAIIGTKLKSYFPTEPIPDDWDAFCNLINLFYIQEYLQNKAITLALPRQEELNNLLELQAPTVTWEAQRDAIMRRKTALIQSVLNTRIQAINPQWTNTSWE